MNRFFPFNTPSTRTESDAHSTLRNNNNQSNRRSTHHEPHVSHRHECERDKTMHEPNFATGTKQLKSQINANATLHFFSPSLQSFSLHNIHFVLTDNSNQFPFGQRTSVIRREYKCAIPLFPLANTKLQFNDENDASTNFQFHNLSIISSFFVFPFDRHFQSTTTRLRAMTHDPNAPLCMDSFVRHYFTISLNPTAHHSSYRECSMDINWRHFGPQNGVANGVPYNTLQTCSSLTVLIGDFQFHNFFYKFSFFHFIRLNTQFSSRIYDSRVSAPNVRANR